MIESFFILIHHLQNSLINPMHSAIISVDVSPIPLRKHANPCFIACLRRGIFTCPLKGQTGQVKGTGEATNKVFIHEPSLYERG